MLKFNLLALLMLFFAWMAQGSYVPEEELGIYEKLDEYIPSGLIFVDENYDTIDLKKAIDKPTVLVPVYYRCPGLCSPLLQGVAEVISRSPLKIGEDYQVFTFSFSPTENPRLAMDKKETYSKLVKEAHDLNTGWKFLTSDSADISRLLNSIGYKVKKTGDDFIHPGAIIVLSPDGKITRYLHGTYFLPFDLKMAIVEASHGQSGPTINKVLKFCFSYDASGKKYVFNITKVSGAIILFVAISFFISLILKNRKKKSSVHPS